MANRKAEPLKISFEKLGLLLEKKGKKWQFLRDSGMSPGIVSKMKDGTGHTDTRTIQKVCEILNCQPGDIMEYIPDKLGSLKSKNTEPAENPKKEKVERNTTEPQNIDLHTLYAEYGREKILSALGQLEIYEKYGETILHNLVEYARTQQIEQD